MQVRVHELVDDVDVIVLVPVEHLSASEPLSEDWIHGHHTHLLGGFSTSLTAMMLSCFRCLSNFISLSVLLASVRFSNALPIFLIAVFSPVTRFLALHTTPYAPLPIALIGWYFSSIRNSERHST